jgi:hypothetical protein
MTQTDDKQVAEPAPPEAEAVPESAPATTESAAPTPEAEAVPESAPATTESAAPPPEAEAVPESAPATTESAAPPPEAEAVPESAPATTESAAPPPEAEAVPESAPATTESAAPPPEAEAVPESAPTTTESAAPTPATTESAAPTPATTGSAAPPPESTESVETLPTPAPTGKKHKAVEVFLWVLVGLTLVVILGLLLVPYTESYVSDRIQVTLLHNTVQFGHDTEDSGGNLLDRITGNAVVSMDSVIANNSMVDLHVDSITYTIYLNDSEVGRGQAELGATGLDLDSNSKSTVPIKVRFPVVSAGIAEIEAILQSKQDITVRGTITASHTFFTIKRKFEVAGISPEINILK